NTNGLVLQLARAACRRDPWGTTNAVRALVEHEEKKKSGGIAEQLRALLPHPGKDPQNQMTALKHLDEVTPQVKLDDLQLHDEVRETVAELIIEQHRAAVLAEAGLRPRNRILLTGPPGNGKTSVAEGIASALGRRFYVVSYDTLIGSHLGETGSRLRQVADYIGSHECVALFDEFEAVGKERDDGDEIGEMKRVVASLLVHLERMPASTVVVAATNHPGMLDRATWRRFQIRLELEAPNKGNLVAYLSRNRNSPHLWRNSPTIAEVLSGASYAETAEFCNDIQRRLVLYPEQDPTEVVKQALDRWTTGRTTRKAVVPITVA
ncbi:MAG: AAA family ATPase, partial [Acidobacteria bacterium]|nr:AAA family ATPase [Acidobacteriota bacterium]